MGIKSYVEALQKLNAKLGATKGLKVKRGNAGFLIRLPDMDIFGAKDIILIENGIMYSIKGKYSLRGSGEKRSIRMNVLIRHEHNSSMFLKNRGAMIQLVEEIRQALSS